MPAAPCKRNAEQSPRDTSPEATPRLAIAYLRVSTDEQRLGPEAQAEACERFATSHGYTLHAVYLDRGVSGATPVHDRPGLSSALDSLRDLPKGTPLIVAKRDRIARDVLVSTTLDRAIRATGSTVLAADGTGNGTEASDAFMRTILDGVAEYERALIRSRTKAALRAKRARGERAGNVPFGFDADASGRLTPNAAEQETIARIRSLAASGEGQRAIVRTLAAEGHASRSGRPLGLSQVQRILAAS